MMEMESNNRLRVENKLSLECNVMMVTSFPLPVSGSAGLGLGLGFEGIDSVGKISDYAEESNVRLDKVAR